MGKQQSLFQRIAIFLGAPIRLPGWAAMLLAGYSFIPDNKARLEFWMGLKLPPVIATTLASPLLGVVLILIAAAYLWYFRGVVDVHHHHATVVLPAARRVRSAGNITISGPPLPLVVAEYGPTGAGQLIAPKVRALSPPQDRLLGLVAKYLEQFASNKLIISRRDGALTFDGDPARGSGVSLMQDLFGSTDLPAQTRFVDLVESVPPEYLRHFPEMRWDSPFVVGLTDAALQYLRHKTL